MRFSDDLMISNYLACHNVKRRVLTSPEYSQDILWNSGGVLAYGDQGDALHRGAGGSVIISIVTARVLTKLAAENKLYVPPK